MQIKWLKKHKVLSESFLNFLNSCGPDLNTLKVSLKLNLQLGNRFYVLTTNDLKSNIKHDDSRTQTNNQATIRPAA